ncbi:hypothetical protein HDU67_002469 [Dinochytrium kinnereticum]|nr:hypothetical protein HDU67_002469 [Dinochytrium kinnereticum]
MDVHNEGVRILQALRQSPENADMFMIDLQSLVSETSEADIAVVLDSLFDKEFGILSMLRNGDVINAKAKTIALKILSDLFTDHSTLLKERALDITALCSFIFNSKEGAPVKKGCVNVLSAIIEARLLEQPVVSNLFQSYMKLYTQYENKYVASGELDQIFNIVKLSILPVESMTRFAIALAGLRLFQLHAEKFRDFFLRNDEKKLILSIHSCLRQMCDHKNTDLSKAGFRCIDSFIVQYFMRNLITVINTPNASFKDIAQAIRSIGKFTDPIRVFMSVNEYQGLMEVICVKASSAVNSYSGYDLVQQVGAFFTSFASLITLIAKIEGSSLSVSDSLCAILLENFAKIRESQRRALMESFTSFLYSIYKKSHIFQPFWRKIALDALVRTCSEPPFVEETILPLLAAHEEYFDFWVLVLQGSVQFTSKEKAPKGKNFTSALYDEILYSMFDLMSKLDLRLKRVLEDSDVSEPVTPGDEISNITAENAVDHATLNNFAIFAESFFSKAAPDEFLRWIGQFGEKCISYSAKFPLVSSFYKLLAIVLKTLEKVPLLTERSVKARQLSMFSSFALEVLLRMEQFKDDLLSSCLRVLLVCPREVLELSKVTKPLRRALSLGLSYTPLATLALDTIEEWLAAYSLPEVTSVIKEILPCFMDYLSSYNDTMEESTLASSGRRIKSRPRYKKTYTSEKEEATPSGLRDVIIRIGTVIGQLGGFKSHLIMDSKSSDLTSWSSPKKVLFKFPFQDFFLEIYLDELLPTVVTLAENSADRRTKVAACEFLHSVILLMIGGSQSLSESGAQTPFHDLYARIFPVILRLSVDLDQVTRELFRPLTFQIIHWLTKNSRYENPETMALLKCCFDMLASDTSNLRDFGSDCIAEFFKWSIKHSSDKGLEQNPMNVKSLLKRFYQLCQHVSPQKRLGASLMFGKIYKNFREHETLLDQFAFEILHYLLFSVKIGSREDDQLGVSSKSDIALKHIVKIIVNKSSVFTKESQRRRMFPGLKVNTLDDSTGRKFIMEKCRMDPDIVIRRIEENELTSKQINESTGVGSDTEKWLKSVELVLDCYCPMLQLKHIDPSLILNSHISKIFSKISLFGSYVENSTRKFTDVNHHHSILVLQKAIFTRILQFFTLLSHSAEHIRAFAQLIEEFLPFVALITFRPSAVCCNIDVGNEKRDLHTLLANFFSRLREKLYQPDMSRVTGILGETLSKSLFSYTDSTSKDIFIFREILFGLSVLASSGCLLDVMNAANGVSFQGLYNEIQMLFPSSDSGSLAMQDFFSESMEFILMFSDFGSDALFSFLVYSSFFYLETE